MYYRFGFFWCYDFFLNPFQSAKVHDYCAEYQCRDEGWKPEFKVCWCPDKEYIESVDKNDTTIQSLERCCPNTKLTILFNNTKVRIEKESTS